MWSLSGFRILEMQIYSIFLPFYNMVVFVIFIVLTGSNCRIAYYSLLVSLFSLCGVILHHVYWSWCCIGLQIYIFIDTPADKYSTIFNFSIYPYIAYTHFQLMVLFSKLLLWSLTSFHGLSLKASVFSGFFFFFLCICVYFPYLRKSYSLSIPACSFILSSSFFLDYSCFEY